MQIGNILTQQQGAKAWSSSAQGFEAAAKRGLNVLLGRTASAESGSAVGQIVAQYDVSDITPCEFSEMVDKLRNTSALGDSDIRDLLQIRADLDCGGIGADEKVNLLTYCQQRYDSQNANADSSETAAALQRRLNWVQKLATMHEASDSVGIDALI